MRRSTLIVAFAAAAVLATGASAAQTAFSPKSFAGTWNGTWKNQTFGSTGPAKIVAKSLAGGAQLRFTTDFGGNVFGCADPAPESTKPLTKGAGAGHWNEKGFLIKGASKAFGTLTLTYNDAKKTLVGSGVNPTCAPTLAWKVSGKFTGKAFNGTVQITLPDKSKATSTLALTRR